MHFRRICPVASVNIEIFLAGTYSELMEREGEFAQLMNIYQTEEEEENADELGALPTTRAMSVGSKKSAVSFGSKDSEHGEKSSLRNRQGSRKMDRRMSREEEQQQLKRQISTNKNKKLITEEEVAIGMPFSLQFASISCFNHE